MRYPTAPHPPPSPALESREMSKRAAAGADQIVKLIVGAGQASPSPPVGPALGSKGVKSMDFCKVSTIAMSAFVLEKIIRAHISLGVQCPNITHSTRHANAHPSHCTPRPIFPLRHSNATDLLASTQRGRSAHREEGQTERSKQARS